MPVTRRYACDDCNHEWTFLHLKRDEPIPDCPNCEAETVASLPTMFAINGAASKAGDYVQKMAEEDYGLTNFKDNTREGENSIIPPAPMHTGEAEALTMAMKEMVPALSEQQAQQAAHFWQPASSNQPQHVQAMAAPGASEARRLGSDPVELLHKAEKAAAKQTGRQGPKLEVVGRAKLSESA